MLQKRSVIFLLYLFFFQQTESDRSLMARHRPYVQVRTFGFNITVCLLARNKSALK